MSKMMNNGKGVDQEIETAPQQLAKLWQFVKDSREPPPELLAEVLTEFSTTLEELRQAREEQTRLKNELITTRKRVENERARYQELFDFAPDGYLATDARGLIQEANVAAASLLRLPQNFLIGKPLGVFVVPELRRVFREQLTKLRSSWQERLLAQRWEVYLQPRKGLAFPAALTVACKYDDVGHLVGLRWLLRDITLAKQAEETLLASLNFNQAILNSLDAHIAVLDKEGKIVAVNEAWRRFAQENGDPALTHTGTEVNYLEICRRVKGEFSGTAREALAGIRTVLDGSQSRFTLEYICPRPTKPCWYTMYATPLQHGPGGAVIAHVDITERKQVEEEVIHLFEQVHRQREQLRALTRRLGEVQEAERKQLAEELHDQVGQKLTALDLNLNIIRARLPATTEGIESIQARVDDSLALVEQTAGSIRDIMSTLHPPMLEDHGLADTLRWYGFQVARRAGFTVQIQEETGFPRLAPSVESTLFRIAQEALTNIAKHAQASTVTIKLERDEGTFRMIVADDGEGFESSGRVELKGRPGWGLAIMAERAEAISGSCRVESCPGQGTQVIVEARQ